MGRMRERVKKRAQENKNKGAANSFKLPDGAELYKPKKGTKSLDILPYRVTVDNHPEVGEGELWFERSYYIHYDVGPDQKPRICPRTIKKACPICEERKDLLREDDEDSKELADALKPKERQLFNVIDLDDQDKGPQLLDFSYFCFGKQLDEEIREGDDDIADFAELKGGKTLKIRWAEESLGQNKFIKSSRIDFKDRKDYDEDILDEVFDLDKILVIRGYDELQAELHGTEAPEKKEEPEENNDEGSDKEDEKEKKRKEVEKERQRRRAEREKADKEGADKEGGGKDKCPHGHKFGVDTDEYPKDCDNCDIWVECDDAKDEG